MRLVSAITIFAATATECVIHVSIATDFALPPAWWKPVANSPSVLDLNGPECTGQSLAQTQSSPCAAAFSVAVLRTSGSVGLFEGRRLSRAPSTTFLSCTPSRLSRQSEKFLIG